MLYHIICFSKSNARDIITNNIICGNQTSIIRLVFIYMRAYIRYNVSVRSLLTPKRNTHTQCVHLIVLQTNKIQCKYCLLSARSRSDLSLCELTTHATLHILCVDCIVCISSLCLKIEFVDNSNCTSYIKEYGSRILTPLPFRFLCTICILAFEQWGFCFRLCRTSWILNWWKSTSEQIFEKPIKFTEQKLVFPPQKKKLCTILVLQIKNIS